jgi:hypothetical protein
MAAVAVWNGACDAAVDRRRILRRSVGQREKKMMSSRGNECIPTSIREGGRVPDDLGAAHLRCRRRDRSPHACSACYTGGFRGGY